jgi:hypothetical protein
MTIVVLVWLIGMDAWIASAPERVPGLTERGLKMPMDPPGGMPMEPPVGSFTTSGCSTRCV